MGNKQIQRWLAPTEQFDVQDGKYPVLCILKMEPPTSDPREVKSNKTVKIQDGYIDLNDAYEEGAQAASQGGPGIDTVVGAGLYYSALQLIMV